MLQSLSHIVFQDIGLYIKGVDLSKSDNIFINAGRYIKSGISSAVAIAGISPTNALSNNFLSLPATEYSSNQNKEVSKFPVERNKNTLISENIVFSPRKIKVKILLTNTSSLPLINIANRLNFTQEIESYLSILQILYNSSYLCDIYLGNEIIKDVILSSLPTGQNASESRKAMFVDLEFEEKLFFNFTSENDRKDVDKGTPKYLTPDNSAIIIKK